MSVTRNDPYILARNDLMSKIYCNSSVILTKNWTLSGALN